MLFGKIIFVLVTLCFYDFCVGKDIANIKWLESREYLLGDVKLGDNVTEACTSDSDCGAVGRCEIQNGSGICKCMTGIIGDKCNMIKDCEENRDMCGNDPQAECTFDFKWRTAYCRCKVRSKRFDVETKTCEDQKPCERSLKQCKNEGYCAKKKEFEHYDEDDVPRKENVTYCQCPLGTSGDFCGRVEECLQKPNYCGDGKKVECRMNPRINKIYCQCLDQNQRFDWKQKICVNRKECRVQDECLPYGRCTDRCQDYEPCIDHQHIENKSSCHCVEGTSGYNCEVIDDCHNNVLNCGSDKSATCRYYHNSGIAAFAYCECINKTLVYDDSEKTCKVCDCGSMSTRCVFENGNKVCKCKEGSFEYRDQCQDCECGEGSNGCSFDGVKKSCFCKQGYLEYNEVCERCECGTNATNCTFDEEGKKSCTCKSGFKKGNYSVCTPMCSNKKECANGGLCLQDICVCLAGTGGPYCETVYECEHKLCGEKEDVQCKYDTKTQRAYCHCLYEKFFDPVHKKCKSCTCGDYGSSAGECEIRQGQKVCQCTENNSYNPVTTICESCYCEYGNCRFDFYGRKKCACDKGFLSYEGHCRECDCGLHGTCRYVTPHEKKPMKVCTCDAGYDEYKGICLKCGCGPNGKCLFNSEGNAQYVSKCLCDPGFQELLQTCKLCDCGPDARGCYFKKNTSLIIKVCHCPRGFIDDKGYCRDIDECLETKICSGPGTVCENTIGSFKCRCQSGYIAKIRISENEASLCQKEEEKLPDYTPWKIGYGILSAGFITIIIGLVVVIFRIRKN